MNLETTYLGLKLRNPIIGGASPYCDDLGTALELEDGGAGAIVMRSLFEEQIAQEQLALMDRLDPGAFQLKRNGGLFSDLSEYQLSPTQYLQQIERLRSALSIPVIASLNGCGPGGWTDYASRFESAGASAIELNLYQLATDSALSANDVETRMLETVSSITSAVKIPVSVKLSPFHTSPVNFVGGLEKAGAAGVVVFNRFYQLDFNISELDVEAHLTLSSPADLLLRLRWLAILSPRVQGSLAATGGVHNPEGVIKAILAGAHGVQVVSLLLRHGPKILNTLLVGLRQWMLERGFTSVDQFRGLLNLEKCRTPAAYERASYQRMLQSWRV